MQSDQLPRTHACGDLRPSHAGQAVTLKGWVHRRRDLGGLIFIDLRDRSGLVQVLFNPASDTGLHQRASQLKNEYVVAVQGVVKPRQSPNKNLPTGEIEIEAQDLRILNEAETPPIVINEEGNDSEEVRLKYRFLDLRRAGMQRAILFRHKVMQSARRLLTEAGFIEVETPILMKSTPEGARDFLVPSRINPGKFYALPQSPQTYKQILMVAGFDRYFQIARCFRDEDLRADRQLEFTQIDCELSFVSPSDIYDIFGRFIAGLFRECMGLEVGAVPHLSYASAMDTYGSDKPDLRFGLLLVDFSPALASSQFKVFRGALDAGGVVKGFTAPAGAPEFSRKTADQFTERAKSLGAAGLVWFRVIETGLDGPSAKFLSADEHRALLSLGGAKAGDFLFMVAGTRSLANKVLGDLRLETAKLKNLIKSGDFKFLWVTDFPMFEWSETDKRFAPMHHPFTAPLDEDAPLLSGPDYYKARAKAYDLVLNGSEIGGGSIRIHRADLQSKVFGLLGILAEEAQRKFGFLLNAFKYGAPPHGGIAFGLDRLLMLMLGLTSIRDVIAFPKTTSGASLMDEAPSEADPAQLKELGIQIN